MKILSNKEQISLRVKSLEEEIEFQKIHLKELDFKIDREERKFFPSTEVRKLVNDKQFCLRILYSLEEYLEVIKLKQK